MKKIIKQISKLLFTTLLFLPLIVKADMAAPMSNYLVRISNPNGARVYTWETASLKETENVLKYDETYTVEYEELFDNNIFIRVTDKETGFRGYIKYEDIDPLEIDIEKFKKEKKLELYAFDDTNYLYKGPSKIYGKVEPEVKLEVGTTIETEYYDEMWAYVEYNGIKGWVYKYSYGSNSPYRESSGLATVKEGEIVLKYDNMLLESPKTDKELSIIIPYGTKLKYTSFYSKVPHTMYYLVNYNNTLGWIYNGKYPVAEKYKYKIEISKDIEVEMYEQPNKEETREIVTIPENTVLFSDFVYDEIYVSSYYHIKYNGNEKWIRKIYAGDTSEFIKITQADENEPIDDNEPHDDFDQEQHFKEQMPINTIIILCVSGAVILSLTALVTIKLINNKKKENEL